MLEGEPFKEIFTQPSLKAGQTAKVHQVVTHLLDETYLFILEVSLQESQR